MEMTSEQADYVNTHLNGSTIPTVEALLTDEAVATTASPLVAHVDVERGVFVTSRGDEIELSGKRVSSLMLERLLNEGKPRIPMKEVLILGKHKQMEATPNDPGYLALLEEWNSNQRISSLVYIFTVGVKGKPDAEFVEDQSPFFENISDTMLKYLWVCSRLPDDDIDKLAEAIVGQGLPTAKGLDETANFTPSAATETP